MAGRVLLCASALIGGGLTAHFTRPHAQSLAPVATREVETPVLVAVREPVPRAAEATLEAPEDQPEPAPVVPDSFATSMRNGLVMTGSTPHRLVLFTFDDGPDHRYTPGLLDTLDSLGIKAVFFLTARRFEGNTPRERLLASIAQDIVRRGHFVGSHTMDHLQLPLLTPERLDEQVLGTERVFERVLGQRPWLIRPPGGARSSRVDRWLSSRGYTQVLWNIGTGDTQVRTSDEVVGTFHRVLERRELDHGERGGVVLLHDIHAWSVEAFPRIVRDLEERNCTLLEQGEELYDIVSDPRIFFTSRGAAGTSETAPPVVPDPSWLERRQARLREQSEARCTRLAMR